MTAISRFATSVAVTTPQMPIPSIPLAPKLNTEMTMAMPIQMLAKPSPLSVRRFEVTGTISAETSVFFVSDLAADIGIPPFKKGVR